MPAKGTTTSYRPIPSDFETKFVEHGWSGIEAEVCAHAKTIARWIDRLGRDRLKAARAEYLRRHGPARSPVQIDLHGRRRRGAEHRSTG